MLLMIATLIGMGYMISSTHFILFYLGLELASIPIAALAAYESHKSKSAEAGIKFILLASFSSGILLFGISLIYGITGSMYFTEVVAAMNASTLSVLGLILFFTGLSFKISRGCVLTLSPPLTIGRADLDQALTIVENAITAESL